MLKKLGAVGAAGTALVLSASPAFAQAAADFTTMQTAVTTNVGLSTGFITGIATAMIGLAFIGGVLRTAMGFGKQKK